MGSKLPKKKDSRERIASAVPKHQEPPTAIQPIFEKDEKGRKTAKIPIPVWPEWSDQDIAAEKWDTGHRVRMDQKGRSPGTSMHFFEEPEGRIELPQALKEKVHSWRRLPDLLSDGKVPVVVESETLKSKEIDLLSCTHEAVTDSELMRWIISAISELWKISNTQHEGDSTHNLLKSKPSKEKETKESKMDKMKKESEIFGDELSCWKPWHHIWPKDLSSRHTSVPLYNSGGKYCLKIFWMGCWRKITIDDFIPCDENGNILLPRTNKENELWPILLSKALVKIASLEFLKGAFCRKSPISIGRNWPIKAGYAGGNSFSEMGDCNMIHCLTSWLPEPIPLRYGHTSEIWKLLLEILPNWKLPVRIPSNDSKIKLTEKDSKLSTDEELKKEETPRPSDTKETKEGKESKGKKEDKETKESGGKEKGEKGKGDKQRGQDKQDKSKDKAGLASLTQERLNTEPEFVLFASYTPPPTTPLRISTLREMADASEKLRQSGLSHNHPHPVHITMARNCPLIPPPTPIPIPRWRLIRQKKKTQIVEPPLHKEPPKPPMFVELTSPFINYSVSPIPVSRVTTPVRCKKYKPETSMGSLTEEENSQEMEGENGEERETPQGNRDVNFNLTAENLEKLSKSIEASTVNNTKVKAPYLSSEIAIDQNDKDKAEKEKPGTPTKPLASKSSILPKKDRLHSGKGSTMDFESSEKKGGRKLSGASAKTENASVKGRKMSRFEKQESKVDKDGKEQKLPNRSSKENLKENPIDVIPEVEVTEHEGLEVCEIDIEAEKIDEEIKENEKKERVDALWMEYDHFCRCFSTLWIFHKSQTYSFYKGHSELKASSHIQGLSQHMAVTGNAEQKTDKKRLALNPTVSQLAPTPSGRQTTMTSPPTYGSHQSLSDAPSPYLFVDSLSKIELLVSFTSFSRWFEPLVQTIPTLKEKEKEGSEVEEKPVKENTPVPPPFGVLVAEPYSWKSLVTGQPCLRIKTTGIKAAVVTLPPGRHVIRFMIQAPIGYHVDIASQTNFIFGEEDLVMQNLTKESLRFTQHAVNTIVCLSDIMQSFNDPPANRVRKLALGSEEGPKETFAEHFEALFCAFTQITRAELGASFTNATAFALAALKQEKMLCLKKHLFQVSSMKEDGNVEELNPEEDQSIVNSKKDEHPMNNGNNGRASVIAEEHQSSLNCKTAEDDGNVEEPNPEEDQSNGNSKKEEQPVDAGNVEEVNAEESQDQGSTSDAIDSANERDLAAVKIQKCFKGHFVRMLARARIPETAENEIATENFKKIATAIDANPDSFALQVYRYMFKEHPELLKTFPFYKDEWTGIAYADYNGTYPEMPVNSWFIVFRETFYAQEPMLVVPKLYVNIPTCVLRVIDNDTGEDLPRVFMRVAPKVIQKNKHGYTFVAEGRSSNAAVPTGKFRMRLIGAAEPLPTPIKEGTINTHFTMKEVRDYYVPNRKNVIFRNTAKVIDDHQVSIQLATSKTDVYIRLEILDNESVVARAEGKGHVVLPAFTFLRDRTEDDEKYSHRSSRSGRSSVKGIRAKKEKEKDTKRTVSPFDKPSKRMSKVNPASLSDSIEKSIIAAKLKAGDSTETLDQLTEDSEQPQTHKYIIQAVVLRDSWPLSKSQWNFISMLKNIEKTDGEGEPSTATKPEKHSAGPRGRKGAKDTKDGRTSKAHQPTPSSRPGSQQFDITKPNWVLRVVSDAASSEIEIKKDTERQDEIKAMKAAWEAAEPGRAAKAQQTRQKFLSENLIKVSKGTKEGNEEDGEQGQTDTAENAADTVRSTPSPGPLLDYETSELTLLPPPKEQEMVLKPFDISPFVRSTGKYILLDDAEEEKLRLEMEEKIKKYKEFREAVLQDRENDRIARNLEKEKQLQEYEEMQAKLNENRQRIHKLREEYRQKFIQQLPPENAADTKRKTPSPSRGKKSPPRSKSPKDKGKAKSPPKGKKK